MKKSFLTLLVSILLAFTLTAIGCTSPRQPSSSTESTPTSSISKESSLDPSSSSAKPSSSSSLELINPSANSASSGVVIPSVNSNANNSASAINPAVSGTSSAISSGSSTQTSSSNSVWLPNIEDYDSNGTPNYGAGYDDSTKYNYSGVTYTAKQGGFTTSGTTYTTNAANTIAVNTSTPFPYGTISVDLTYVGGDSGIIFGYKNTGSNKWEGSGVSFYFLFINSTYFHLGKSTNGTWETKGAQFMGNNDTQHTYNLKVVLISNKIIGIIDNLVAFTIVDNAFLTGTNFGFRAGVSGTKFSNLTITNNYTFESENYKLDTGIKYTYNNTFTTLQGGFTSNGANHTSSASNSLMVNTTPFRYGSMQVDIKPSNSTDNGIIFAYSKESSSTANWEGKGLSYYFLFVSWQGIVILGKTDHGVWSTVGQSNGAVVKDFSKSYKLTLVYKEREIKAYLDGTLMFSCYDSAPLFGNGFGLRTGGNGVALNNFTVTSNYLY